VGAVFAALPEGNLTVVMHRQRAFAVCAASVGGVLAVAAAVAGLLSLRGESAPLVGPTGLSLVLVFGAGVAAVLRPRHTEILTLATILVGMALIAQLYGRLGMLYAPALVLMAAGIVRSQDAQARRRAATIRQRAVLATEWERQQRLAEQERAILRPRPERSVRRAG